MFGEPSAHSVIVGQQYVGHVEQRHLLFGRQLLVAPGIKIMDKADHLCSSAVGGTADAAIHLHLILDHYNISLSHLANGMKGAPQVAQ